jgi:hypothetical protein
MRSLPLILCLLAVGLSPVIGSQDSPQVRVPQEQLDARSFLYAVYPELRTKSLVIDIAPAGNGMALRIAEPLPSPLLQRDPPLDPLMVAVLEFDRHNTLSAFRATGRLLKSDDNGRLRERLRNARTPEAALSEETTRFAIKTSATLASEAPLAEIADAIGLLSTKGVAMRIVARDEESANGAVWEMSVSAKRPSAPEKLYILQFEPFAGRLVHLKQQ